MWKHFLGRGKLFTWLALIGAATG